MNDNHPTTIPSQPEPLPPVPRSMAEPPVYLGRILLGLIVSVATFDLCFWTSDPFGFSLAIFFPVLTGIVLANRSAPRWPWTTKLLLILLAGAAFAAVLETGFVNVLVLLLLTGALAGDTYYTEVASPWGRWLSQAISLLRAPGRVFWLAGQIVDVLFREGGGWVGRLAGGCLLTLPALALTLIFAALLAYGNAVFGDWAGRFFAVLWDELASFLDPVRILLWVVIAFLVLPLLRPSRVSAWWWDWIERLPHVPEFLPTRAAIFSNGLTLAMLNLLFLVANFADALYLWSSQTLPDSLSSKSFVHEGVAALIVATLLSAVVLTAIFQQAPAVARNNGLKALAGFWIAQNLFLMISVALRVKNYIVDYNMTVDRLSVIVFLLLVATGYLLLAVKIFRDRSLSWLVGGCVLAVFVTFYVVQFLDLAGWSANYNVARWEKDRNWNPMFSEIRALGPAAWPALRHAHEIDPSVAVLNTDPQAGFVNAATVDRAQFDSQHWRGFSLRAWLNRWALDDKN